MNITQAHGSNLLYRGRGVAVARRRAMRDAPHFSPASTRSRLEESVVLAAAFVPSIPAVATFRCWKERRVRVSFSVSVPAARCVVGNA